LDGDKKIIFQENWNHARHVENERLYFAQIFGAIVVGVIAIAGIDFENPNIILFSVLYIIGQLGYLLTIKLSFEFKNHIAKIEAILAHESNVGNYMGMPMNFGVFRVLKLRVMIIAFYIILCSFLFLVIIKIEFWGFVLPQAGIMIGIFIAAKYSYENLSTSRNEMQVILDRLYEEDSITLEFYEYVGRKIRLKIF